jgi:hypothetical protein
MFGQFFVSVFFEEFFVDILVLGFISVFNHFYQFSECVAIAAGGIVAVSQRIFSNLRRSVAHGFDLLGNLSDMLITLVFVRFEQIKESVKRSVQVPLVVESASIVHKFPL